MPEGTPWIQSRLSTFLILLFLGTLAMPALAATYFVDGQSPEASDDHPGTAEAPWKTVSRAAAPKSSAPGDTVVIRAGVYREHVEVTVSGQPGRPITFTAAPGARVVLKGSEPVRGTWTRLGEQARDRGALSERLCRRLEDRTWATNSSPIPGSRAPTATSRGAGFLKSSWTKPPVAANRPRSDLSQRTLSQTDDRRPRSCRPDSGFVLLRCDDPDPVREDGWRARLARDRSGRSRIRAQRRGTARPGLPRPGNPA